jgi:ribosome biogenesis GTPase
MQLTTLGWDDAFALSFERYAGTGYQPGRVAVAHREQYHLYTEDGDITARLTGNFRYRTVNPEDFPAVGDWVVIQPPTSTDPALIQAVLPRKSQFARKVAGERTEVQIVAANIDTIFLVCGLDHDFNLRRIERYLVMAWESQATPVVVLNKADLCDDLMGKRVAVEAVAPGVPIMTLSALCQGDLVALAPYLQPGHTVALLGSSGVGKSTLTNQLMGQSVQATQAVRADDSHGRHTTTHREMLRLPSGALLIDTPGMRELQLWTAEASFQDTFTEIEALAQSCRFHDCQHRSEPGCAVHQALETGELSPKRFASYQKLQREQAYLHRQQNQQASRNSKARWKKINQEMRQRRQK